MMAGHSDNDMGLPEFDKPVKVALVIAPYYTSIAEAQLSAARGVLDKAGVAHETIEVPGSLEIPTAIGIAHRLSNFDGYVALGCVIRGATSHYDVVVNESARALTHVGPAGGLHRQRDHHRRKPRPGGGTRGCGAAQYGGRRCRGRAAPHRADAAFREA
jgi:6,7-dimethyl-8-ribityllumazine synthase